MKLLYEIDKLRADILPYISDKYLMKYVERFDVLINKIKESEKE